MTEPGMNEPHPHRDAETLMMLGGFMVILAVPVLFGTIFAESSRAMVVNVAAGGLLLAIGVGFFLRGRAKWKR